MGRSPCRNNEIGLKKGPWTPEEDQKLVNFIQEHGHRSWRALPKLAGKYTTNTSTLKYKQNNFDAKYMYITIFLFYIFSSN